MRRTGKILWAVVAAVALLLVPAAASAETMPLPAIAEYTPSNYDVRSNYTGEIGFYFKAGADLTVTEVAVPFFEGNVRSTVFLYELLSAPAFPGQIATTELKQIASAVVVLADGTKDDQGFVHVALANPVVLAKGKEYLITLTAGKLKDDDYVKFYNSGLGASPKAVVAGPDVQILSCTFSYNVDTTKLPLFSDGAQFAIDVNVPSVAFGFPNFYYTSSGQATPTPEATPTPSVTPVPPTPTPTPVPPSPWVGENGGLSTLSILLIAVCILIVAAVVFFMARGGKTKK
jgi:hypothetical protein